MDDGIGGVATGNLVTFFFLRERLIELSKKVLSFAKNMAGPRPGPNLFSLFDCQLDVDGPGLFALQDGLEASHKTLF